MVTATQTHSPHADDADIAEMAKYGITRVPVAYFHVGGFRYTTLSDAIAEGKRQSAKA